MITSDFLSDRLDIITACRRADLTVLRLAEQHLRRFVPFRKLHVVTAGKNIPKFRRSLGESVELQDEDELIADMKLRDLAQLQLPGFPKGAGWYFQQLLKFAFCFREQKEDYYLIWDADTIPLRPLQFFDETGRMLFTLGDERHGDYFPTYKNLLREEPNRDLSFIAQHMIVQKSVLREMLARIEANFPEEGSWAWKIMRHLVGTGNNLFSEYETLGHFVNNNYPERAVFRKLSWLREGALQTKGVPSQADLQRLAQDYHFAAFESGQMPLRRFVRRVRARLKDQ